MDDLNAQLARADVALPDLAAQLDALDDATRRHGVLSLSRRAQARLFEAAADAPPLTIDDLVPDAPPFAEVVHEGRNTLPTFRRFAKVFCRPADGARELWGYNRTHAVIGSCVGPGYFVACDDAGAVLIDYTRLPADKPAHWPPILDNGDRLSRFVYHGMQDVLRRVSSHVSIGRARRRGRDMDSWFVLCRTEPRGSAPSPRG